MMLVARAAPSWLRKRIGLLENEIEFQKYLVHLLMTKVGHGQSRHLCIQSCYLSDPNKLENSSSPPFFAFFFFCLRDLSLSFALSLCFPVSAVSLAEACFVLSASEGFFPSLLELATSLRGTVSPLSMVLVLFSLAVMEPSSLLLPFGMVNGAGLDFSGIVSCTAALIWAMHVRSKSPRGAC